MRNQRNKAHDLDPDSLKLSANQVLQNMAERPCRENIRNYKKEMKEFRAMLGMGSVNISHGKLA